MEPLFDKVVELQAFNFIKIKMKHRFFLVKFPKFLRTPFFAQRSAEKCTESTPNVVVALTHNNYRVHFSFQPGTSQLVLVRPNLNHNLYTMSNNNCLASNCLDKSS